MMTLDQNQTVLQDLCAENQSVENLVLALTGNPGAGKSAVAELFHKNGAIIIDADKLGYEMLLNSSPVYQTIVNTFGCGILNNDQDIVRAKLGQIVFQDQSKLNELNAIVHPPMLKRIEDRIKHFRTTNESGPLIIDAALIFEWEIENWFDAVMVVTAPKELRHQRYIESKGGSLEKLSQREAAQIAEETKIKRADILIHNDRDVEALQHRINQLYTRNH